MSDSYKIYASQEYVDNAIAENVTAIEVVSDEEILMALIESDLIFAVVDADNSILTDENGNIIEW